MIQSFNTGLYYWMTPATIAENVSSEFFRHHPILEELMPVDDTDLRIPQLAEESEEAYDTK
jgi:hypothetical protein